MHQVKTEQQHLCKAVQAGAAILQQTAKTREPALRHVFSPVRGSSSGSSSSNISGVPTLHNYLVAALVRIEPIGRQALHQVPEPAARILRVPLLSGVVYIGESEAVAVAICPLEVVQE